MKKIVVPAVDEQAEYVCDVTGKPAYAKMVMTFGYGSERDLEVLEMDLSDQAAEEIIQFLKTKSPGISLREGPVSSCPLCGRR